MGDSITEGTIIKQLCPVGTVIKEGDVVALIETDKVTVDIKALSDGVITNWHATVDSTVLVGGDLYTIDTDASKGGSPPPPSNKAAVSPPPSAAAAPPAPSADAPPSHGRHPSIHFLGKSGWAGRRSGHDDGHAAAPATAAATAAAPAKAAAGAAKSGPPPVALGLALGFDPMRGRPPFSQQEMDAIDSGGATVWDKPKPVAKPGDKGGKPAKK